jgi:hypothetical protein
MGNWSRGGIRAVFLLAAAAAATPASAGDLSELSCPPERLSAAQAEAMGRALTGRSADTAETGRATGEAVAACGVRFGWTEAEEEAALRAFVLRVQQAQYRQALEARGVDHAWIEAQVLADDALIEAAVSMQPNPAALAAFVARMEGLRPAMRQSSADEKRAVGAFLFSTAALEGWRRRFVAATPASPET